MQRWVRLRKIERMLSEGWKKTDETRGGGGEVLMEKAEPKPRTRARKPIKYVITEPQKENVIPETS